MSGWKKGVILGVVHLLMVASLGAKLVYDRATRPRAWARVVPYDPNLPIRGRYVSLQMEVLAPGLQSPDNPQANQRWWQSQPIPVVLSEENHRLVARKDESRTDEDAYRSDRNSVVFRNVRRDGQPVAMVKNPVLFFIPEHIEDPSRRANGEELWVEVTLPKNGPPRPIRLAVIKQDGTFTPLDLR